MLNDLNEQKFKYADSVYQKYLKEAYYLGSCEGPYDAVKIRALKASIYFEENCKALDLQSSQYPNLNILDIEKGKINIIQNTYVNTNIAFIFTQSSASSTWQITHNLGFYPNVTVVDSNNRSIDAQITYISKSEITITFSTPTSGKAYLS